MANQSSKVFVKLAVEVLRRQDISTTAKLVQAAILDRMNSDGRAYPGYRTIARDVGCSVGAVQRAMGEIQRLNLLVIEPGGKGRRTVYKRVQNGHTAAPETDTPGNQPSVPKAGTEVCPLWTPNQTETTKTTTKTLSPARALYEAYPRHVARARALKAIDKAIVRVAEQKQHAGTTAEAVAWLTERVQKFAASPAGQAGKFTPYPATWFNQERYDDDDSEWQRAAQEAESAGRGLSRVEAPKGKYEHLR